MLTLRIGGNRNQLDKGMIPNVYYQQLGLVFWIDLNGDGTGEEERSEVKDATSLTAYVATTVV